MAAWPRLGCQTNGNIMGGGVAFRAFGSFRSKYKLKKIPGRSVNSNLHKHVILIFVIVLWYRSVSRYSVHSSYCFANIYVYIQ